MRTLACLLVLVAACGDDGAGLPATGVDAAIDAFVIVDASPDAPPPIDAAPVVDAAPIIPAEVTTACTHACGALGACFGKADPVAMAECVSDCSDDLLDCSSQQVATIDACSTEACGTGDKEESPLLLCIMGVACVEM